MILYFLRLVAYAWFYISLCYGAYWFLNYLIDHLKWMA